METAAERKARLKAMRAAAEESGVIPVREADDECVPCGLVNQRASHGLA